MITYGPAISREELAGILSLQQENLPAHISSEELQKEGFVTVHHSLPLLEKMNQPYPHIIAKEEDRVIGYTLVMLPTMAEEIPVLVPMIEQVNRLVIQGKSLGDTAYFVMGQVCIAKRYRGKGVFAGLYQALQAQMRAHFDWCITEIASRNPRSLRAHEKLGFESLHTFSDDTEEWVIVGLKLGH